MEARDFAKNQTYFLEGKKDFHSLRCIDDRYKDGLHGHYAVPGAHFGIMADVIAGFEKVLSRPINKFEFDVTVKVSEEVMGTPAFHTANSEHPSPVAGCGYLFEAVEGKKYLSPEAGNYFKLLASTRVENGYQPLCFNENHNASFVLVVKGNDIGIIPLSSDGTQAYVVHVDVRAHLLMTIAQKLYKAIKAISEHISEETFVSAVLTVADERATEVLHHLANGKDMYTVENVDGTIVVERIEQEAMHTEAA